MATIQIFEKKYQAPGVYVEDGFALPGTQRFTTGVPLFLGLTTLEPQRPAADSGNAPRLITLWSQFTSAYGEPRKPGYLAEAVHGFFKNGGEMCYVRPVEAITWGALNEALESSEHLTAIDLVCVPDIGTVEDAKSELQQLVVTHCEKLGTRFAILDSQRDDDRKTVENRWNEIDGLNGALYFPWIRVLGCKGVPLDAPVPPSGHIAGIYARSDRRIGVHKAPANEAVEGALSLARPVTDADQAQLNPSRVNCLRSFPGRGIRVWGARTISGLEPWKYINVRRLFLTAARWVERNMFYVAFETNDPDLWARIERELTIYFTDQYDRGALKGDTPQESFYVKCDSETNPPDLRDSGQVITEIGLAPAVPYEFVVVRLLHGPRGATIAESSS